MGELKSMFLRAYGARVAPAVFGLTLWLMPNAGSGQPQDLKNMLFPDQGRRRGTIIIGKLVGHDDYRDLRVRLRGGEYVITRASNSYPFEVLSFNPSKVEIRLDRYFGGRNSDSRRIVFKFFPNERQLMTSMILEQVDYAVFRTRSQASEVNRANPEVVVIPLKTPANRVEMLLYNLHHPVLSSVALRRAISYAINKRKMVEELLQNDGLVARGTPYESDSPYFARGLDDFKYNPKRAVEILHTNGWDDLDGDGILERGRAKLSFNLAFEKGVLLEEQIARRIKLDLFEIGVEIIPVSYTKIDLLKKLKSGDYEIVLYEHRFDESLDALYRFFADPRVSFINFKNRNFNLIYHQYKKDEMARALIPAAKRLQAILNRYTVACFMFYRYYDYHLFNINKLGNFYDEKRAEVKPFDEWIIRPPIQR